MIVKATMSQLEEILLCFEYAKDFMKENNNPNQWKDSYPPRDNIIREINDGYIYVLVDNDEIYGVFFFKIARDQTYDVIKGKWLNDKAYGVIHRVCSNGKKRGVFKEISDFTKSKIDNIRIDTHADNIIMQRAILKEGYKYCGIINILNGDERLAYQYVGDINND